jgi:hypothetical protein
LTAQWPTEQPQFRYRPTRPPIAAETIVTGEEEEEEQAEDLDNLANNRTASSLLEEAVGTEGVVDVLQEGGQSE